MYYLMHKINVVLVQVIGMKEEKTQQIQDPEIGQNSLQVSLGEIALEPTQFEPDRRGGLSKPKKQQTKSTTTTKHNVKTLPQTQTSQERQHEVSSPTKATTNAIIFLGLPVEDANRATIADHDCNSR